MGDHGLLLPGVGPGDPDDDAVLAALVRAEVAWVRACEETGRCAPGTADRVSRAGADLTQDPGLSQSVGAAARETGNPVIPLLTRWREALDGDDSRALHAGLTSQDVVDTALMIVVQEAARTAGEALSQAAAASARLARTHRSTPALAHTLSQPALTTTFGARAAAWFQSLSLAAQNVSDAAGLAPVAWGGAVGTADPHAVESWAAHLGLQAPPAPWHTVRSPVLRISAALSEGVAAAGHVAGDVLAGARAGRSEVAEPAASGRGASSAMPHKSNPVLSILIRRSAIAAPAHAAQVATTAGLWVDERPDGAWHAEWPALRELARHAVIAARTVAELATGLSVDSAAMAANLDAHGPSGEDRDAAVRLAEATVDRALAMFDSTTSEGPAA